MAEQRLEDYVPVHERVQEFRKDHKAGSIVTVMVGSDPVTFRAEVSLDGQERPVATGHASEEGGMRKGGRSESAVEKVETAAVGRALAFLGYQITRGIASREEVEKATAPEPQKPWSVAGVWAKQIGMTKEQVDALREKAKNTDWKWWQIVLQAKEQGATTPEAVMAHNYDPFIDE